MHTCPAEPVSRDLEGAPHQKKSTATGALLFVILVMPGFIRAPQPVQGAFFLLAKVMEVNLRIELFTRQKRQEVITINGPK